MKYGYIEERDIAVKAVTAAGLLCRRIQMDLVGEGTVYKMDKSPVTVADFSAQAVICRMINDSFPDDPVVGEEDSRALSTPENEGTLKAVTEYVSEVLPGASSDDVCRWIDLGNGEPDGRFWTLDPIDGTKGFIRGDQYAVALALMEEGEVKVGVLACPNLPLKPDEAESGRGGIFTAIRGEGAAICPLDGGKVERIRVSGHSSPSEARTVESFESGHANHSSQSVVAKSLGIAREPVRMDSQAKYGVVARGEAEIYLRMPSPKTLGYRENIWDHAAGILIVEEAGGRVTDIHGNPLDFTRGRKLTNNRGVAASNGRFHDKIIEAISATSD